jgi:DNA-binding transcriptional LysR family regulator
MERHRKVAALWNWLPAFRGVAEYESVQRAAVELAISPSALSRSVRLLEDALGHALFLRHGAGLKLTPQGQELFLATKEAIRRIDDIIAVSPANRAETLLTVAASSPMVLALLEACALQLASAPLPIRLRTMLIAEEQGIEELLRGGCDLLVGIGAPRLPDLVTEPLGELHCAMYAAEPPAPKGARFIAVTSQSLDSWRRQDGDELPTLEVSSVAFSAEAAHALGGTCILPELPLAYANGLTRGRRVSTDTIFSARRKPVSLDSLPAVDSFVELAKKLLSDN